MIRFIICFILLSINTILLSQDVVGIWEAIDDKDGQPSSHILIEQMEGKLTGKIIKIFEDDQTVLCENCKGDKKNLPVVGMEILWDLKNNGDVWENGKIMDPENGKTYKCKVHLENEDTLKVRGYIGIPALGRTQTWHRVQ